MAHIQNYAANVKNFITFQQITTVMDNLNFVKTKTVFLLFLFVLITNANVYSQNNKDISDDFIRIANKITSHAEEINNIWSGFWPEEESFLFMKYDSVVHVYNVNQKPKGDYELISSDQLTDELKGKAFKKKSYLPEYKDKERSFPGLYKINKKMIYALDPKGSNDFHKIEFYLHESFHFYQNTKAKWEETVGDTISIKFKTMVLDSMGQVDNQQYINLQNYERDLLSKTLDIEKEDEIKANLKKLLVAKTMRNTLLPDKAVDLIERYQRREGTATYTGLYSSVAANNFSTDSVFVELKSGLKKPLKEFGTFPAEDQQFLRWPQYAIGAAYCIILDRLDVEGWKEEIANGATLYELAEAQVDIPKAEFERISDEILNQ